MTPTLGVSSSMLLERPLEAAIDFAKRQGFRAFEVWADHPHAHPDETPAGVRPALRRALAGFTRVSMHGPLGNASLASINPGIWRESVREHVAAVELAHDLGASVLVVHPGDLRDRRFATEAMERSREAIAQLAARAEALAVTLAIENCGPYHAGIDRTAADLAAIVSGAGSERVRACLDSGHGAVNGNTAELLRLMGDLVAHAHVHDNHGQRDEHLPMGEGTIDFSVLGPLFANFDGMAIAEIVWEEGQTARTPEALAEAAIKGWTSIVERK